jgi:hypothetical protein
MQATHPDHLRQLVDAHGRTLREEVAGARLARRGLVREQAGDGLRRRAPGTRGMTSRVIVMARRLRQSAWRTTPATRGDTP